MKNLKLKILQLITVISVIALDQATKLLAIKHLMPIKKLPIITGVFNLRYVENTGAAFSMLQGQRFFLVVVPMIVIIAIVYLLISDKIKSRLGSWSLAVILSGAIGNLVDRIMHGYVVDMFDFELISFPVFNVADIAVTVGAILFFIYAIFFYEEKGLKNG